MLTRSQKEEVIQDLRDKIEKSQALFITNLVGMKSNDSVALRKNVREANGTIVVTRNTLFEKAAKGTKCESVLAGLKGTNAVAFAFKDAPAVAKVLFDAGKESELVTLGKGLLGTQVLTKKDVEALAKLPSRDQMLATLLATFNAPVSAFVRTLDAIKRKQEEGAGAVATAE